LINLHEVDVHAKIAGFMHMWLDTHDGNFGEGFVLALCDYISSLGFSDSYVKMLVQQFINDTNNS